MFGFFTMSSAPPIKAVIGSDWLLWPHNEMQRHFFGRGTAMAKVTERFHDDGSVYGSGTGAMFGPTGIEVGGYVPGGSHGSGGIFRKKLWKQESGIEQPQKMMTGDTSSGDWCSLS